MNNTEEENNDIEDTEWSLKPVKFKNLDCVHFEIEQSSIQKLSLLELLNKKQNFNEEKYNFTSKKDKKQPFMHLKGMFPNKYYIYD